MLAWTLAYTLQLWRSLATAIRHSYRPELHYMRGPGPKWRQKHVAGQRCGVERDARHAHDGPHCGAPLALVLEKVTTSHQ